MRQIAKISKWTFFVCLFVFFAYDRWYNLERRYLAKMLCFGLYFLLISSNTVNASISPHINYAAQSHSKWAIWSPCYWALAKTYLSCDFLSVFPYSPILCPLEFSQTAEFSLSSCFSPSINLMSLFARLLQPRNC